MSKPVFEQDIGVVQQPPPPPPETSRFHPEGSEQSTFRESAKIVPFFRQEELDDSMLRQDPVPGATFSLSNGANVSLTLAHNSNFFNICEPILWGSEDRDLFGEMLRGLVINFRPTNVFHLHMLRAIAEPTWQLMRASKYKRGVFENGATTPGLHGLPVGTSQAFEANSITQGLLRQLDRAIEMYKKVV